MSKPQSDQPAGAAQPQKGRIVTALSIKRARRYADNKAPKPPGATPPTSTKPAPPPKVLSPAELVGKPTQQVTPQVTPQVPTPPPPTPPIPPIPPLEAEGSILDILFARAFKGRMDTKPADDPGIAMLQSIVHQMQHGQPLKAIEDIVVPQLGEMASKIHLIRNVSAYHDIERRALYAEVCWMLEKALWKHLVNQELTPAEKLALLELSIKENDKINGRLADFAKDLEKSGKGNTADVESAREKVDRVLTKVEDPTAKDLQGTSSVGRELARRVLDRAGKAAEALVEEALKKPA